MKVIRDGRCHYSTRSPAIFPPEIVTTSRRPDITIYSPSKRQCISIELAVPATLAQANSRKKIRKYEDLIQEGQSAGWELKYFPVEVGSGEFTNNTLHTYFKFFGLTNKEIRKALDSVARTALGATYTLWLVGNTKQLKMNNLLHPSCDQPEHERCLHSSRCLVYASAVQGLPSVLLLKCLLGKTWKGLARWFKLLIPTDPGLK